MQENIAFRKTLKKVAALGTSLAMVGVTISGALAVNLGDYSSFSRSGTAVVFGEAGSDSVAVSDVVAGLPGAASSGSSAGEPVAGALELSDFEDGESEDFALGLNLSQSTAFGKTCFNENDDTGLVDWEQNININTDKDYDVHEEFCFGTGAAVPRLTGSLAELDDDLGTEPILIVPKNGLNYTVVFEEALDANNRIANATTSNQIKLNHFLGSELVISSGSTTTNQFTALVGDHYQLSSGDTVVAGECTVNVLAVDNNEVLVDVNGETKSVNENSNERYGACEVQVDSAIETTDGEGIVVLYIGDQASETFTNGDHYAGEDKNNYLWEWELANLNGANPVLGALLSESFTSDRTDFEDEIMDLGLMRTNRRYLAEGDYLCAPNWHQCLIMEGLKAEADRCTVTIDATGTDNLPGFASVIYGGAATYTDASILEFEASGCGGNDQGFKVDVGGDGTFEQATDRVLLFWDGDLRSTGVTAETNATFGELIVYYENSNGNITMTNNTATKFGWNLYDANGTLGTESVLFQLDNSDFDNADITLWDLVNSSSSSTKSLNHVAPEGYGASASVVLPAMNTSTLALLRIELGDEGSKTGGSEPSIFFEVGLKSSTGSGIDRLGAQTGSDTTKYFTYASNATVANSSISGFDNDVLANSGVIISDLEDNYDDDKVVLEVPNDDEYNGIVRVAKPKTGVVSTTGTVVSGSVSMSDSEVTDVAGLNKDVVVVGGPAVNKVAADLLGVDYPAYGSQLAGLEEGTAVLEMKALTNGKSALLVYGWEQDDTRRAAVLLRDPAVLTQKLSDAGLSDADSATVTGTDFSVAGITVSA